MLKDFLEAQGYKLTAMERMNWRIKHVIEPLADLVRGATVLDLGAHDGRWPIAYRDAGAAHVLGIEGRGDLVDIYKQSEEGKKPGIDFIVGDFVAVMDDLISQGKSFDVVSCLGVYYHTMHHYKMLMQMTQLKAKAIVIDSVFNVSDKPIIELWKEKTEGKLRVKFNTISQVSDQTWAPVGKISRPAMEMMAESLGYKVEWVNWDVPQGQRRPVIDYFKHRKHPELQRFTCVLKQANTATGKAQIESAAIDDDDDDTDD